MSDDVTRVKEAVSIVDVIGEFVDLKPAGKNYKGLCPFHKEKTPSFVVSEERGIYKCFGCGEYGDVFSFLMKRDNMTFVEALNYLADRAGIVLDNSRTNRQKKTDLEKYYRINDDARRYFYENLLVNKKARAYLRDRGISDYSINEFSLGYADESWDTLVNFMVKRGHRLEDLFEIGLVGRSKKGNYYDTYRDRLIFPIINIRDRVIGFGGRTLGDDRAKYINSSDSLIYNKSKNLYGLNLVHKGNDRDRIILVEGYMDVIGLSQAGFKNTVAALGTALTEDQAKLCNKYAKQVYLCYDSDAAGRKASLRAIEIFTSQGVYPKIISLDQGLDPDDYIREYGGEAFEERISLASNHIDYQLDLIIEDANLEDPNQASQVLEDIARIINPVKSEVLKDEYIEKVAERMGVNPMSLASDLGSFSFEARQLSQPRRDRDQASLPATLLIALIFSIHSQYYYLQLKDYIKYLEDYNLGYIYNYLVNKYEESGQVILANMVEDLDLSERQADLLSFANIKDEPAAYQELKARLKRFDLEKERDQLKDDISMLSSLVDPEDSRGRDEELRTMLNRLHQVEIELKSDDGWRG